MRSSERLGLDFSKSWQGSSGFAGLGLRPESTSSGSDSPVNVNVKLTPRGIPLTFESAERKEERKKVGEALAEML